MNNRELFATLRKEIGNTRTVYYRDILCGGEKYTSARIMELKYNDVTDGLRVRLLLAKESRIGHYAPPMDNVSIADIYLPSPINSRFHGDMVPVRTYFELQEREQGSLDHAIDSCYRYLQTYFTGVRGQKYAAQRYQVIPNRFEYIKIIFSGPCTIVIWKDGTKTMTRVSKEDEFDPEKGVAICFMKRALGHTETNKLLRKELEQYWDGQKACTKEYIK